MNLFLALAFFASTTSSETYLNRQFLLKLCPLEFIVHFVYILNYWSLFHNPSWEFFVNNYILNSSVPHNHISRSPISVLLFLSSQHIFPLFMYNISPDFSSVVYLEAHTVHTFTTISFKHCQFFKLLKIIDEKSLKISYFVIYLMIIKNMGCQYLKINRNHTVLAGQFRTGQEEKNM